MRKQRSTARAVWFKAGYGDLQPPYTHVYVDRQLFRNLSDPRSFAIAQRFWSVLSESNLELTVHIRTLCEKSMQSAIA